MLKAGENVVMMDEIKNAEDVYGKLTNVVSTSSHAALDIWLMPGARPMAKASQIARSNLL